MRLSLLLTALATLVLGCMLIALEGNPGLARLSVIVSVVCFGVDALVPPGRMRDIPLTNRPERVSLAIGMLGFVTVMWAGHLYREWTDFAPVAHSFFAGEPWRAAPREKREDLAFALFFGVSFLWLAARGMARRHRRARRAS